MQIAKSELRQLKIAQSVDDFNKLLAWLSEDGEIIVVADPEPEPEEEPEATEAAAELADEAGISLEDVEGSGVDGRILKADVEDAIEAGEEA